MRFLISSNLQKALSSWGFPIGTFFVNLSGCLLIGFLAQLMELKNFPQNEFRAFCLIGILGGYTTFSSFGYETWQLIRSGEYSYAVINAGLQVLIGLVFVWLGGVLAKLF